MKAAFMTGVDTVEIRRVTEPDVDPAPDQLIHRVVGEALIDLGKHAARRLDSTPAERLHRLPDDRALLLPLALVRQQAGVRQPEAGTPDAYDREDVHVAPVVGELGRALDGCGRNRAPLGGEEHAIRALAVSYDVGTAAVASGTCLLSSTLTRYQ